MFLARPRALAFSVLFALTLAITTAPVIASADGVNTTADSVTVSAESKKSDTGSNSKTKACFGFAPEDFGLRHVGSRCRTS